MNFLVLGATGATGALFTEAAIDAGHEVTAVVRDPARLAERAGLRVIGGDVRDADVLTSAVREGGSEAVVSALGVGKTRTPDNLILDTTRAVLSAAARTGLRRVVIQSAFGVGPSYKKAPILLRLGYHLAPAVFADKAEGEKLLTASDLDWTLVYPVVLTDGPRTGNVAATDLTEARSAPRVTPRLAHRCRRVPA